MERVLAFSYPVTFPDNQFWITGSSDATKTIKFEVDAQTTGDDLTINSGAQTDDRTLTVPVLTGNRTLAVIDQAQTFTETQTISGNLSFTGGNRNINTGTSNGSDDKYLSIAGGGADGDGRGSFFNVIGNDYATASFQGVIEIYAGYDAGFANANAGSIRFQSGGGEKMRIWRSGGLEVRAAPSTDPGQSNVHVAGHIGIGDGVSAPSTVAGMALIYVDSADGDLKVKFGDGTVKTIVTD